MIKERNHLSYEKDEDTQARAVQCPTCSLWLLVGQTSGRLVAVTAWTLTPQTLGQALVSRLKVYEVAGGELRRVYPRVRAGLGGSMEGLHAQHPCPLPPALDDQSSVPPGSDDSLCLAASESPQASRCQRTAAERSVSCSTCDPAPFAADEPTGRAPFDGYARSLLVRELGAVVIRVESAGKVVWVS